MSRVERHVNKNWVVSVNFLDLWGTFISQEKEVYFHQLLHQQSPLRYDECLISKRYQEDTPKISSVLTQCRNKMFLSNRHRSREVTHVILV